MKGLEDNTDRLRHMWDDGRQADLGSAPFADSLQGLDLGCSACLWAAKRVHHRMLKDIKGMKRGSKRAAKVVNALPHSCAGLPKWPRFARLGLVGSVREFVDEESYLNQEVNCGGHEAAGCAACGEHEVFCNGNCTWNNDRCELKSLETSGFAALTGNIVQTKVEQFCGELLASFGDALVNQLSLFSGRVGDFNFGRWLCYDQFRKGLLCSRSRVMSDDDAEEQEETDEEDL